MRDALNYPDINKHRLEVVKNLIDRIAEPTNKDCKEELVRLSCITGKNHEAMEFAEYWSWIDLDALAINVLAPEPPCVQNLTFNEMKEIVSIIRNCLTSKEDLKAQYYIGLIEKSLLLTDVICYIMTEKDEATVVKDMIGAVPDSVIVL